MFKKQVKYKDYDGNDRTDTLYFNLNKFEWLELEAYTKGGLIENLQHALETNNVKKTIDILKKIILRSYGEKDPETGTFMKSEDISLRFSYTEAFSELFHELAYNEEASREFFLGLIPQELRDEAEKEMEKRMAELADNNGVIPTPIKFQKEISDQ